MVVNRCKHLTYSKLVPDRLLPSRPGYVKPSLESFDINFNNIFYGLGEPPAILTATFEDKSIVTVYILGQNKIYAYIVDSSGRIVKDKSEARNISLDEIHVLPQVAPLLREETILTPNHVRANVSSTLAPLHFRNQLHLMHDKYQDFVELAAKSWSGLSIKELIVPSDLDAPFGLLVQDGDFFAEVSWMGHGLQMWLQTIWFIARTPQNATIILDEPDVYLHPDLQKRLFRLVRLRYPQIIIATHSTELMSEANPGDILVIDRKQKTSQFADDNPTVQKLVDHIGSSHNINLARLQMTKRFLLIEGHDLDFLNLFHLLLFKNRPNPLTSIPHLPVGGWGGWDYAIGSTMTIQNYIGGQVTIYCILDSDYHTPEQKDERYRKAQELGIQLHIWSKKELENYLLIPETIGRVIKSRAKIRPPDSISDEVMARTDNIAAELRDEVIDGLGNEFLASNRKGAFPAARKNAEHLINNEWQNLEGRWSLVSGRKVLSLLSDWAQKSWGASFGPMTILRELRDNEIPSEMVEVIQAIENEQSFSSRGVTTKPY